MRENTITMLVLGALCLLISQIVSAATLGPLDNFLIQGESDGWQGSSDRGAYWLENPSQEGAIRYFYTPYVEGDGGKRHLSIDVDVSNTTTSARAGLLYGLKGNPLRYFMLLFGRGGEVELYRRDQDGVNLLMSATTKPLRGFNRVEMREKRGSFELYVNGKSMGSIESNGVGEGSIGIAAMGVGRFGFANYVEAAPSGGLLDNF